MSVEIELGSTGGSIGGLVLGAYLEHGSRGSAGGDELQATGKTGKHVCMFNKTRSTAVCTYRHMGKSQHTTTDCVCKKVGNLFGKIFMLAFSRQCHAVPSTPNDDVFIHPISLPPLFEHVHRMWSFGLASPDHPCWPVKGERYPTETTSGIPRQRYPKNHAVHELDNVAV